MAGSDSEEWEKRWPAIVGRLTATGHLLPVRVYYEDTDFSGFVYHAGYVRFLERGRSDFLRLLGIVHTGLAEEKGRPVLAVRRMAIEFIRPARLDDMIEVETRLAGMSGARIEVAQAIRRGAETLVEAQVSVVLIGDRGRPLRIPAPMRARLAGHGRHPL